MIKKANRRPLLISLIALGLIVLCYLLFYTPSYNWYSHSYSRVDEEPYGADLVFKYLKTSRGEESIQVLDSTLSRNLSAYKDQDSSANYIAFGYQPYVDSLALEDLMLFVENGNNAYFFCDYNSDIILDHLNKQECILYVNEANRSWDESEMITDSLVNVNLEGEGLKRNSDYVFGHYVKDELKSHFWHYYSDDYFCEENETFISLGTLNEQVNFMKVDYRKGTVYFHSSPKFFTNYYLTTSAGRDYTEKVFSHLQDGPLIWDAKQWKDRNYYQQQQRHQDGPLSYLLSMTPLRWALYLIFSAVTLFFIFSVRRKQRAIPVMKMKENSSMEYVETISSLYFNKKGDGRIFRYLSDQFKFFVKERYRIPFRWNDSSTWPLLSKASGIAEHDIVRMAEMYSKGSYEPNVTSEMLVNYYGLIEGFYSNCK